MMPDEPFRPVVVGRLSGVFGVQGWVRVFSDTQPRDNILNYNPWLIGRDGEWRSVALRDGQRQGKGFVALLEGCDNRDQAMALAGLNVAVRRDQLAVLEQGEYYWSDLIGLKVFTRDGVDMGRVKALLETGAHDVLVVAGERERLIPYAPPEIVKRVDLDAARIVVDWDPDF